MFEEVEQPSYSRVKSRSLSPMLSLHSELPSTSTCSSVKDKKSLSPQPYMGTKRKGNLQKLMYVLGEMIF